MFPFCAVRFYVLYCTAVLYCSVMLWLCIMCLLFSSFYCCTLCFVVPRFSILCCVCFLCVLFCDVRFFVSHYTAVLYCSLMFCVVFFLWSILFCDLWCVCLCWNMLILCFGRALEALLPLPSSCVYRRTPMPDRRFGTHPWHFMHYVLNNICNVLIFFLDTSHQ